MQPPVKEATPSIFLYTGQVLYAIPFIGVGERLEVVVAVGGTLSSGERRRGNFVNLLHKLPALYILLSGAHRPCLVLFGSNSLSKHHVDYWPRSTCLGSLIAVPGNYCAPIRVA